MVSCYSLKVDYIGYRHILWKVQCFERGLLGSMGATTLGTNISKIDWSSYITSIGGVDILKELKKIEMKELVLKWI